MNPLTVTWRPNQFTDVGLQNLFRLIDAGLPNVMISPPGDVHRRLTYMAFRELGHPFQPFIAGQRVVGPRIALNNRIKLIFYGENVAEYGNRLEENFTPRMQPELYTCFDFDQLSLDRYRLAGKTLKELIQSFGFSLRDFQSYKSPTREEVEKAGLEVHYMSYYRKWVPQENYYYAVENVGFSQSEQRKDGSYSKYSGIDDYLEDLHYYMQYIKFGMGRCTWDASQEIRSGRLERDEAVTLVKRYDGEPPRQSLPHILSYLRISEAEFWEIVNSFRSRNLFFSDDNGDYHLRKEIS
jgi:N-acetyl sugar amidotransferase